jgi:dTDP-4-amino-4,6-dideoxygalactose transaminase
MVNPRTIPFVDLSRVDAPLRAEILQVLETVVESGHFIGGPELSAFESELAKEIQCGHAIGVSSGTDALIVSLLAAGIGPGDEVITTPFTFFATAGAIAHIGARPVFVDIHPDTFHLDLHKANEKINARTKAVIPVHLFGRAQDLGALRIPIIEDAAQSLGAHGVSGMAATVSFFPTKNLGAYGDAGAVLCNNDDFAKRVRLLRTQGARQKDLHECIGGNFRLDAIQAAILRVKLPYLKQWNQQRRDNADRYRRFFSTATHIPDEFILPNDTPQHIYHQFVIRTPQRDGMRNYLRERGITTAIYYAKPIHLQPCFQNLEYSEGDFPEAEKASREVLALPISPTLSESDQEYIVETIDDFFAGR